MTVIQDNDGVARPKMTCDVCSRLINDAGSAMVVYRAGNTDVFLCGECIVVNSDAVKTMPLDLYLILLLESVRLNGQDFARAKAFAQLSGGRL